MKPLYVRAISVISDGQGMWLDANGWLVGFQQDYHNRPCGMVVIGKDIYAVEIGDIEVLNGLPNLLSVIAGTD